MSKLAVNEGNENKLYYPKPEITGSEAFISIMNDFNSGDPKRMAKAKNDACAQMERIIIYAIKKEGLISYCPKHLGALKQQGFIGVLKAMDLEPSKRYNPYQGEPSAFFYKYIKHELLAYINSLGPACTSNHYAQALTKVKKAIEVFTKNQQAYDETTIAQFTGMPLDTVSVCFNIIKAEEGSISYSDLLENEDDGTSVIGVSFETPEKTAEQEAMKADILNAIRTTLTDDERYIILQFYGFTGDECEKISTIASDICMSENQVKKLKRKALDKLGAVPAIRKWHRNNGVIASPSAAETISFFPGNTDEVDDNTDFTSILGGLFFNTGDMVG